MKKKSRHFLNNYILMFCSFLAIFTMIFYFETSRLNDQKQSLINISKQEMKLTEHLFLVASAQGRVANAIKILTEKISFLDSQNSKEQFKNIKIQHRLLSEEIEISIEEYQKMKTNLLTEDSSYLINLLSIELYLEEIQYINKTIELAVTSILDSKVTPTKQLSSLQELAKASSSLERVTKSYKSEIQYISKNIQELIVKNYDNVYSSNITMTFISGAIIIGFLLYTLFSLILPMRKISFLANSLINNPKFIADEMSYPYEVQEILSQFSIFSNGLHEKEKKLKQEKLELSDFRKRKANYYQKIEQGIDRPLEIINQALHRVHEEANISSGSREMIKIAEQEYLHMKDLILKASEAVLIETNQIEITYQDTNLNEYLNGMIAKFQKEKNENFKVYLQIAPEIPSNLYIDQKHISEITHYALENIYAFKKSGTLSIEAKELILHQEKYLLLNLFFNKVYMKNFETYKQNDYLSMYAKHQSHSPEFHIFQNIANSLGGTFDFKMDGDILIEFRLLLPLVGTNELNEDLVG